MSEAPSAACRPVQKAPGLAGSLGRSGSGAAKSSDPVGVAGRQKVLGVAKSEGKYLISSCKISNPRHHCPDIRFIPLNNI